MVTCQVVKNDFVVMVNVAVALPAGTVMLAGTLVTTVLLVLSEIARPPAGAALLRVIVPVAGVPPATVSGLTVTEDSRVGTVIVRLPVLLTP